MLRVRQIKISMEKDTKEELKRKVIKLLKIKETELKSLEIKKKSLDARKKEDIFYVYEVEVSLENENKIIKHNIPNCTIGKEEVYQFFPTGQEKMQESPIIIGSGPAGLFCAYLLALHGYQPRIIERGQQVEERIQTIEKFWQTGILDKNSNVQFGEGGAGTFSDGKLNTLVKDKAFRGKKVFEILVENGAPEEILFENKPHIGTDLLRKVIKNMREKIISLGGTFFFETCLTDIITENSKLVAIELNHQRKIPCQTLVLAIGHSARDTVEILYRKGVEMTSKPFAVGIRIEHPQQMINESQYGKRKKELKPANYKLTYTTKKNRGVYSFCMCPGGYVVNASSEEGRLAINGMSNYKRDTTNANSALVVTVTKEDYGSEVLAGMKFQRELEEKAYQLGKGKIPLQQYEDFIKNKETIHLGKVTPVTKGDYTLTNINKILPEGIQEALKEAIPYFGTKIKGYDQPDALLSAIESRTSSPVKITRTEEGISNVIGLYPCGEGSGYAGGITTAAMDGLKTAERIAQKYQAPIKKERGRIK